LEQMMIRVTRYFTLVAITVVATLAAALPAHAMRLPPPPDSSPAAPRPPVLHDGMSPTQLVVVALCSSLLTLAVVLAARWARAQHSHGFMRPA
jgi:hypothetical protein